MRTQFPYRADHGELHLAAPTGGGQREFEFALDLIHDGLKRVAQEAVRRRRRGQATSSSRTTRRRAWPRARSGKVSVVDA